jgi:hypothetical protein
MPLIEGDMLRVCGFQRGQHVVAITQEQCMLEERGAVSLALVGRVDTNERQIPMRFTRVIATHLCEDCQDVLVNLPGNSALQQCEQHVFVRVHLWRQPQRCPSGTVHVVGAPLCKRFAPEGPDKARDMPEVLLRLRPRPTRSRVRAQRQDHDIND